MITRGSHPDHWVNVKLGGPAGNVWIDPSRVEELATAVEAQPAWPSSFIPAPEAAALIRSFNVERT